MNPLRVIARSASLAFALAALCPATSLAQPAPDPRLVARRTALTATVSSRPTPEALCDLGEVERQLGAFQAARGHLEAGLQRGPSESTTAAQRRLELRCRLSLARTHLAEQHTDLAWDQAVRTWSVGASLPANVVGPAQEIILEVARARWQGPTCVAREDEGNLDEAEVRVLQLLARGDSPGLRACLGAIRARQAQTGRGTCRTLNPLPTGFVPFTPGASEWTSVDARTALSQGDPGVIVARVQGNTTRYVACWTGHSEAQYELSGAALTPEVTIAVVARITPCGEDLGPGERCPPYRVVWVLDASSQLVGLYTLQRSRLSDRGALAQPWGEVSAPVPLRVNQGVITVGNARLTLTQGALVPAP